MIRFKKLCKGGKPGRGFCPESEEEQCHRRRHDVAEGTKPGENDAGGFIRSWA